LNKLLLIIFLFPLHIYAKDIKPTFILKSSGFVNDEGSVEVFDLESQKLINEIFIKPTFSAQGKQVTSKILSVDRHNGINQIDKIPYLVHIVTVQSKHKNIRGK
jgi:hypothetical protein